MKLEPHRIDRLKAYLDPIVDRFEQVDFIKDDPISIPHGFEDPEDKAIMALFSALLAWGRRDIMMSKLAELCHRMDYQPARFVHSYRVSSHRTKLEGFVHRTFNAADAEGLVLSLQTLLAQTNLENIFARGFKAEDPVESGIQNLAEQLIDHVPGRPKRIHKHLARPSSGSACKRWNMFLRWMVRPGPVDLGLWKSLNTKDLKLPLDLHSGQQARRIGLLTRPSNDWKATLELTSACKALSPEDPARYDFALFGTGAAGELLDEWSVK
ncbi:MAG: TIGR02757 family protein [Bacteroidetes bacterium]|nr:TIGR02757 family protein [Bacteroidota bacterium]